MLVSKKTVSGKRGLLIKTEHFLTKESVIARLAISFETPVLRSSCMSFFEPDKADVRKLKKDAKDYFERLSIAEAEKIIRQSVYLYGQGYGEEYVEHKFVLPYARKFVNDNFGFSSLFF